MPVYHTGGSEYIEVRIDDGVVQNDTDITRDLSAQIEAMA